MPLLGERLSEAVDLSQLKVPEVTSKRISKAQRIEAIRDAVNSGANSLDEIILWTDLAKSTVYNYARIGDVKLPIRYRIPTSNRIQIIHKAIAEGVNSLEEFCDRTHLRPHFLLRFCREHNLKLPPNLTPYKYRLEMDALIEKGATLEQIGIAGGYPRRSARENARLYIRDSGQYEEWRRKREDIKQTQKIEAQQRKQLLERLVYILDNRVSELAEREGWPYQKAIQYMKGLKRIRHDSYKPQLLIKLFKRHENARNRGRRLPLEELGRPLDLYTSSVGRIFREVGLKPMYGNKRGDRYSKEKENAIKKIFRLRLSINDIAYFLDLSTHLGKRLRRVSDGNANLYRTRIGMRSLSYRLASQIYEAQSVGFRRYSDIAELVGTSEEVVRYAINNKHSIAQKIIQVLRIAYANPYYDKPYKISVKG